MGRLPPGTMSEAINKAWHRLDPNRNNSIDLDNCLNLTDLVADILGISANEILSETDRTSFQEFINKHRGEIGSLSRQEFEEFFLMATGKEFNSRILEQNDDEEENKKSDDDMSIESFSQVAMDTSTPLKPSRRPILSKPVFGKANRKNQEFKFPPPTGKENLSEQDDAQKPEDRSPKDIKLLNDQEYLIQQYESQVSDLDKEKDRLAMELRNAKSRIHDLQRLEKQKDNQIQEIEKDLSTTRQKLHTRMSYKPSSPKTGSPQDDETIKKLQDQINSLEMQNFETNKRAEQLSQELKERQIMLQKQNTQDPNTLQQLNMALLQQKRLLAQYSNGGGSPALHHSSHNASSYTNTNTNTTSTNYNINYSTYIIIASWIVLVYVLCYNMTAVDSQAVVASRPWWHGTVLHDSASHLDSWAKERPIS